MKAFFKKALTLLLCAIIISMCMNATHYATSHGNIPENILHSTVFNNKLYLISDNKLLEYETINDAPKTIIDFSNLKEQNASWYSLLLASDTQHLYIINQGNGVLYQLQDNTLIKKIELDFKPFAEKNNSGEYRVVFSHPIIANNILYAIHYDFTNIQYSLVSFSLTDGSSHKINCGNADLRGLSLYKNNLLLSSDNSTNSLITINTEKQDCNIITNIDGRVNGSATYDINQDKIVYMADFTVNSLTPNGKTEAITDIVVKDTSFVDYAGIWNEHYIMLINNTIYMCNLDPSKNPKTEKSKLTIWYEPNASLIANTISNFMLDNPNIIVRTIALSNDNIAERIANENISKDSNIDLYLIQDYQVASKLVIEHQYSAEIQSEKLKSNVKMMHPEVQQAIIKDEKLYAYPYLLDEPLFSVNKALFKQAGFTTMPKTYDEYIDLMIDWYSNCLAKNPNYSFNSCASVRGNQNEIIYLMLRQQILNYNGDVKDFNCDTKELRSALKKLLTLNQYKDFEPSIDQISKTIFNFKALAPCGNGIKIGENDEYYATPLALNNTDKPLIHSFMMYFMINPHSKNKHLAEKFLEYFHDTNTDADYLYTLFPNTPLIVDKHYEKSLQDYQDSLKNLTQSLEQLTNELAEANKNKNTLIANDLKAQIDNTKFFIEKLHQDWSIIEPFVYILRQENIDEINKYSKYICVQRNYKLHSLLNWMDLSDMLNKYYDGAYSMDQFLQKLNQKIQMYYF